MALVAKNLAHFHGYATDFDVNANSLLRQPELFKYNSGLDTQATVEAVGYFDGVYERLAVNDLMYLVMETGTVVGFYTVTDINAGVVTITALP